MNGFLASQVRTWLSELQERYKDSTEPIDANHQLFPWLIRHCAWLAARYHITQGRVTPHKLLKGVEYDSPICKFGEVILGKIQDQSAQSKSKPRWTRAVWVGRLETDNSHVALTSEGAMTFRSIRRVPDKHQFESEVLLNACGLPWASKQLREKITPVVSHPLVYTLPVETQQQLQDLSEDEAEPAPADLPAEAAATSSSSSDSSSSASPVATLAGPSDVLMTPRNSAQTPAPPRLFSPERPVYGLNPVQLPALPQFSTPPPAAARVQQTHPEASPSKLQRISGVREEMWNEVRLWAEAEETNLASTQLGAVMDLLDTQLDPTEIRKARIEELRKLASLNGFTPVSVKSIPKGAKVFYTKWVDKKSKGIYKSRCTFADIKARYSKLELEKERQICFLQHHIQKVMYFWKLRHYRMLGRSELATSSAHS
jgi:hypothetical protein